MSSEDSNEQLLNNIQSLQTIEKSLFSSLDANPNLTEEQKAQILDKINDISKMRMNLYKTLNNVNGVFESALITSQGTLKQQTEAIGIVETQLNDAKTQLNLLEEEKNNQIRLIEINNFYGDKYADQSNLMKLVVYFFSVILILAILYQKALLPKNIFIVLLFIISTIFCYYIVLKVIYMWNRDNMNYQEYNWYFNAASAPAPSTTTTDNDPWASTTSNNCPTIATATTSATTSSTEAFHLPSNSFHY